MDLEDMLKKELEGMNNQEQKSNRFSTPQLFCQGRTLTTRIMPSRDDMR